ELGQGPPFGPGLPGQDESPRGGGGQRDRDGDGLLGDVAERGQDARPHAAARVELDRAARGGGGVVEAGEELGDQLLDRQARLERGGDGEQRGEFGEVGDGAVGDVGGGGAPRGRRGLGVAVDAEPDGLAGGVVGGAPRGREAVDQEQAASALGGDVGHGGV